MKKLPRLLQRVRTFLARPADQDLIDAAEKKMLAPELMAFNLPITRIIEDNSVRQHTLEEVLPLAKDK